MRPALRARLADEDRGLTVVELMVAMGVLTIVATLAVTSLVGGMRTSRYSQDRGEALQDTMIAVERVSRELRAADPLRTADEDLVAVDVRRDGRLYHYRYEVRPEGSGWELVEERWRFDDPADFDDPGFVPTAAAADETREVVLVPDLADDGAFTFLDSGGDPGASAADTRQIEIAIERTVAGDESIVVETTVKVRNA